jgi:hypothetical protein
MVSGSPTTTLQAASRALVVATVLSLVSLPSHSDAPAAAARTEVRDGSHDFDFNVGTWHTHIRRILDPLSGGTHSMELNGTVTVRKVWGGRAQLEEIEADGPNGHWEGLTLFLYNPAAHQWGQSYINSIMAELTTPLIGEFHEGRGELFAHDTFEGKSTLVRGVWSDIRPDSHRFEESYSRDGGESWHPTFIADLTRQKGDVPASAAPPVAAGPDGQHAFDFDFGAWKTQSTRLLHPLTGSKEWVTLDGKTLVNKVWNGRANLVEYKAEGPSGTLELLGLRWFNPTTGEWSLDFATPGVGVLGNPGVGTFKNGRADFYDYEPIDGRSVLVRFSIWATGADTAQSEQAFSIDGGKSWEVNWINKYTRPAKQ